MPSIETYGMIIYGGVTTVLFLIISVLAYQRLNDENTSIAGTIATPKLSKKGTTTDGPTLFPFNRIKKDMTIQEIQHISTKCTNNLNLNIHTPTDNSILFNAHFWSNRKQFNTPDLNEQTPAIHETEEQKYVTAFNHLNVDFRNANNRYSLSNHSYLSNVSNDIYSTPHMDNKKRKSNDIYFDLLANGNNIEQIHLRRQRSAHSIQHLENTKRTCFRVTVEYFKELVRNRSIYSPSLQHTWDVASDISVLLKWGKHAFMGTDIAHIDYIPLFWTSLLVQLSYRIISSWAVYKSQRSKSKAALQLCDVLMVREIYISHIDCRVTDTLVYIKKLEAVLEAAPQLILTTYFFLRVGTLDNSYTEIIGWLWSFFTLSTKVINDDSKMYKHIKSRWNKQFIYRMLFRLFEICSRVLVIGLIATAVSARAAMVFLMVDSLFLIFSYYYGLLSNDKMNILGSLITFVDLTIYPKVSPLYSWYVTQSNYQRYPIQKVTQTRTKECVAIDIGELDSDFSHSSPKKMRKLNLALKISVPKNLKSEAIKDGQKSVRERSSVLLKEMESIDLVYLELQSEERANKSSMQYKCLGCCCWCKCLHYCHGCVPQFLIEKCVNQCFLIAICMSWVWCTYFFNFILCKWCNEHTKIYKMDKKQKHQTTNQALGNHTSSTHELPEMVLTLKNAITEELDCPIPNDIDSIQRVNASNPSIQRTNTGNSSVKSGRSSISERTQKVFQKLKSKRVQFDMPNMLLKDRRKNKKLKNSIELAKIQSTAAEERKNESENPTPQSDTITDSKSVMKMLDFAQQNSAEIPREHNIEEEAPADWWKMGSGTKFSVTSMRSLHSTDGGFPDIPEILTPLGENEVDPVYPINRIEEESVTNTEEKTSDFAKLLGLDLPKRNVAIKNTFEKVNSNTETQTENTDSVSVNLPRKIELFPLYCSDDNHEMTIDKSSEGSKTSHMDSSVYSADMPTDAPMKKVFEMIDSVNDSEDSHSEHENKVKNSRASVAGLKIDIYPRNLSIGNSFKLAKTQTDVSDVKSEVLSETVPPIKSEHTHNLTEAAEIFTENKNSNKNIPIRKSIEFSETESLNSSDSSTEESEDGINVRQPRNMAIQKSFHFSPTKTESDSGKSEDNNQILSDTIQTKASIDMIDSNDASDGEQKISAELLQNMSRKSVNDNGIDNKSEHKNTLTKNKSYSALKVDIDINDIDDAFALLDIELSETVDSTDNDIKSEDNTQRLSETVPPTNSNDLTQSKPNLTQTLANVSIRKSIQFSETESLNSSDSDSSTQESNDGINVRQPRNMAIEKSFHFSPTNTDSGTYSEDNNQIPAAKRMKTYESKASIDMEFSNDTNDEFNPEISAQLLESMAPKSVNSKSGHHHSRTISRSQHLADVLGNMSAQTAQLQNIASHKSIEFSQTESADSRSNQRLETLPSATAIKTHKSKASIEMEFSQQSPSSNGNDTNDEFNPKISAQLLVAPKSVNSRSAHHHSRTISRSQHLAEALGNMPAQLQNITSHKSIEFSDDSSKHKNDGKSDVLPPRNMAIQKSFQFSKTKTPKSHTTDSNEIKSENSEYTIKKDLKPARNMTDEIKTENGNDTPNLATVLGNMTSKEKKDLIAPRNMAIDKSFEFSKTESLNSTTENPKSHSQTDNDNGNGLASLLGIANIVKERGLVPTTNVRNMAIDKSFEFSNTESNIDNDKKLVLRPSMRELIYTQSGMKSPTTDQTSYESSGNVTPFLPNEAHTNALLALAGLGNSEADRLKKLFTNKSALNTPVISSQCSTANGTPTNQMNHNFGFPDIDHPTSLSRKMSLYDRSMTILERPIVTQLQDHKPESKHACNNSMDVEALKIDSSPLKELNLEIMVSNPSQKKEKDTVFDSMHAYVNSGSLMSLMNSTPHFSVHTPKISKIEIKPFCGIKKFIFDRGIVHRYAFLVVLARTMQSMLFLVFITYIVYVNPKFFGGKTDINESNPYTLACAPWCTSQELRNTLRNSYTFMEFLIVCCICCTFSILFFMLSSPYLLFATSIQRSAMSLLKTGCIYDSIQYFSKKAKCKPLEILKDYHFMQMFFGEIIKRRIPVFYYEKVDYSNTEFSQDEKEGSTSYTEKLQHKILKKADSEILLTSLQLNVNAQLAEYVAIQTIKNGYLHLLQFIMTCALMTKQDRLIFDPSNCVDEDGNSLLHVAIIRGDENIIQYVLDVSGYDQRKNMSNQDVIDLLILNGDIHILRLMVGFFKDTNRLDLLKRTFFRSIKRGNMEFVTVLIQVLRGTYDIMVWIKSYVDRNKGSHKTLLMYTSINGHANTTEWLLDTIKVDATLQDRDGKTALILACINQNVNVVAVFMKHEHSTHHSYINIACKKRMTPLLYATIEGSLDCVSVLLQNKKLDPNISGGAKYKETALIHASRYGHQEIALQLIKTKKINVNMPTNNGKTALMFASRYGFTKIVKALLSHDDIDVNCRDSEGNNALNHAEQHLYLGENYQIIKKAIVGYLDSKSKARNVDPEKLKQKRRSFIMIGELAAKHRQNTIKRRYSKSQKNLTGHRLSKSLKKKRLSKSDKILGLRKSHSTGHKSKNKSVSLVHFDCVRAVLPLVDLPIDDIEFYLWYSIQMDYDMVCHWLLQNTHCTRDLIGREDLDMIDTGLVGRNPFHFAVKTGADKCLRILLEMDGFELQTCVNEKDKEGYTPLIYAVLDGKITIIELLLNYYHTEINESDDNHTTPLMHAAIRGYANIVQLLIKHALIDVNYVDNKGQTALCLAVRYNRPRVVQLLLTHKDINVNKSRNNGKTPLMFAAKNGLLNVIKMLLSQTKMMVDLSLKDYIQGNDVWSYLKQCKQKNVRKKIYSLLSFYKIWKSSNVSKSSIRNRITEVTDIKIILETQLRDDNNEYKDENGLFSMSYHLNDSPKDFYTLASKEVEIRKMKNDWNTMAVEIEIEDKLFSKWSMQLEILHICADRQDDIVFKKLWHHWISQSVSESITEAIRQTNMHSNSFMSSLHSSADKLSAKQIAKRHTLLKEKEHFQSLKWYYFLVMISQKGWHRLFIRFIQEIQHKQIQIDWKFLPSHKKEIELMAKHGHIDEMEEYLKQKKCNNQMRANDYSDQMTEHHKCCSISNHFIHQKHIQLMLESIFENFGQSSIDKPKLGQCLQFVLEKTMTQYLFNSKCC